MERWNDIDRRRPKDAKRNVFQWHFVHHRYHYTALDGRLGSAMRSRRLTV
jgi:hypothetical protein